MCRRRSWIVRRLQLTRVDWARATSARSTASERWEERKRGSGASAVARPPSAPKSSGAESVTVSAPVPQVITSVTPRETVAGSGVSAVATPRESAAEASADTRGFTIVPGATDTCVLSPAGEAYCWGGNDAGQLGTGTVASSVSPQAVAPMLHFSRVSPGLSHTCALTTNDVAYCWGANDHGELGDGSTSTRTSPVRVAEGRGYRSIVSGAHHSCALTSDGRAMCWGSGARGQLGDGATTDRPIAGRRGRRESDSRRLLRDGITPVGSRATASRTAGARMTPVSSAMGPPPTATHRRRCTRRNRLSRSRAAVRIRAASQRAELRTAGDRTNSVSSATVVRQHGSSRPL